MVFRRKRSGRKVGRSRLGKRWSASIGGFGMRASFNSKRSLAAAVTHIVRKDLETPFHYVDSENSTGAMILNTHYTKNLLSGITQGDTNAGRTGDIIHVDKVKIRGVLTNNVASNVNLQIRLMILKSREQYSIAGAWTAAGLSNSQLYLNAPTDSTNQGLLDPKKVTTLYDSMYTFNSQIAATLIPKHFEISLPIDQKFVYETGLSYGKTNNLYLVAVAFQSGVAGGTIISSVVMSSDVIFKNCK